MKTTLISWIRVLTLALLIASTSCQPLPKQAGVLTGPPATEIVLSIPVVDIVSDTPEADIISDTPEATTVSPTAIVGERSLILCPIPSFPGAEGYGAISVGGRGGRVIEVTNLNNSGPGSLRAAIEAEGPRIVVFRVAGNIQLDGELRIWNSYLTIAGQTAPGSGITIKGYGDNALRIYNKDNNGVHDVVIRYLHLRHGQVDGSNDNLTIHGGHNIIIDHVSMSWSTDENVGVWSEMDRPRIYNTTFQRSIMAEGLAGHSNGMHVSGEKDYSLENPVEAWRRIYDLTIHDNLFIHNTHRNPRVISAGTQVVNNVVYNWKYRIGETMSGSVIDYINNYYKAGPMSNLDRLLLHEEISPDYPGWRVRSQIPRSIS